MLFIGLCFSLILNTIGVLRQGPCLILLYIAVYNSLLDSQGVGTGVCVRAHEICRNILRIS